MFNVFFYTHLNNEISVKRCFCVLKYKYNLNTLFQGDVLNVTYLSRTCSWINVLTGPGTTLLLTNSILEADKQFRTRCDKIKQCDRGYIFYVNQSFLS